MIWYIVGNQKFVDLVRCGKVSKLFDMYYDKYGKGSVQRIDFGYGTVNPKLWGANLRKTRKENEQEDLKNKEC